MNECKKFPLVLLGKKAKNPCRIDFDNEKKMSKLLTKTKSRHEDCITYWQKEDKRKQKGMKGIKE